MKTIKILSIALFAIMLFSCSKDDDSVATEPTHRNLLLEVEDDFSKTVYQYDSNFRIISQETFYDGSSSGITQYTYDSQGKLKRIADTGRRVEYAYIGDKLDNIKTYQDFGSGEQLTGTESYIYGANQITEHYVSGFSSTRYRRVYSFDAVSGNITELNVFLTTPDDNVGTFATKVTYSNYDNKKSPFSDLPFMNFPAKQNNNAGKIQTDSETPYIYTYEYNADGYPTKRTRNTGSIETYQYQRL